MSDLNPEISVIIPVYNGENTISSCINAVQSSTFTDYEIILVDDGSTDKTIELVCKSSEVNLLSQNHQGPAAARNFGAKKAKGKILFFLDADVLLLPDALSICKEAFSNPEIKILNGIYHKIPANPSFITEYKSLFEYYWFTIHPERQAYKSFMGRCAGIYKSVFEEVGGYNTGYKTASVEQEELGFRLSQKYKIYIEPRMQGRHYFPSFRKLIVTYYTRTIDWIKLFYVKKEFDSVMTTRRMSIATIAGPFAVITSFLIIPYPRIYQISICSWLIFYWGYEKILQYFFKEKGFIFYIKSLFTALFLSSVLSIASVAGIISILKENIDEK